MEGLFSDKLIIGGSSAFQNGLGLYSGGLIIGRIFAAEIWWGGGGGREAYFREGFFSEAGVYYRNFMVFTTFYLKGD